MKRKHNCAECACLKRTAPTQVFHLCTYWAGRYVDRGYIPDEWAGDAFVYVVLHCHMQPEAPACPAFVPRKEVARGAVGDIGKLLCIA